MGLGGWVNYWLLRNRAVSKNDAENMQKCTKNGRGAPILLHLLTCSFVYSSVSFFQKGNKEQENEQEVTSPENVRVDIVSRGSIYSDLYHRASIMGESSTKREKIKACIFFPSPLYWTCNQ
jgi:hypothetical protein